MDSSTSNTLCEGVQTPKLTLRQDDETVYMIFDVARVVKSSMVVELSRGEGVADDAKDECREVKTKMNFLMNPLIYSIVF